MASGIRMIDIGVNFTDGMFRGFYHGNQFHPGDIPAVLSRAWSAGVDRIIADCCLRQITGVSLTESREALVIAETDVQRVCSVRSVCIQPDEFDRSGDPEKHFQELLALAKEGVAKGKVVAVGECGLDYDRLRFCPSNTQKKYFVKQFELAETLQLPMFLHMRAAAEDFFSILTQNRHRFTSGVVHSFTGSSEDCLNGCSLKTIENLNVVKGIPIERMMLETDSPYCEIKNSHAGIHYVRSNWPSKRKEKYDPDCTVKGRNEPCLIRQVLEVVASCRGISSVDQLSRTLYYNTCRLFFPHEVDAQADALLEISSEVPEEKA
ncbi:hypothetical protein HPP92_011836 [Vanilla planifolia]|uniref:Uncharacterized protein n=1 Tax=Vanilla planifolia TaxID=51239 RepID=A0A835RCD7_VANPL|nr:hypothetical protein HPP92_011836 [Vanilla planifolia]